jgi:hypothetical protein
MPEIVSRRSLERSVVSAYPKTMSVGVAVVLPPLLSGDSRGGSATATPTSDFFNGLLAASAVGAAQEFAELAHVAEDVVG